MVWTERPRLPARRLPTCQRGQTVCNVEHRLGGEEICRIRKHNNPSKRHHSDSPSACGAALLIFFWILSLYCARAWKVRVSQLFRKAHRQLTGGWLKVGPYEEPFESRLEGMGLSIQSQRAQWPPRSMLAALQARDVDTTGHQPRYLIEARHGGLMGGFKAWAQSKNGTNIWIFELLLKIITFSALTITGHLVLPRTSLYNFVPEMRAPRVKTWKPLNSC